VHRDKGLRSLTYIEADHSLWHHEYHLILGSLPSLLVLNFTKLKLTRFTKDQILWFQELTALKEINFSYCEFEHLPASLTQLSSLKKVDLWKCTKLESLSDSMPTKLESLSDSMPTNLESLSDSMPTKLESLSDSMPTNLESLSDSMPTNLESLSDSMPTNLELTLRGCSQNLVQMCQAYNGQDRQFISSIPVIHIDDTTRRHEGQISDDHNWYRMEIRKPSSDAIGRQACASCGKIFELGDFILRDYMNLQFHGHVLHVIVDCD
jgi:hypothetical protein